MDSLTREERIVAGLAAREDSTFFRELTPDRQQEFRELWRADLERHAERSRVDLRGLSGCMGQGVLIHLVDALLLDVPSWTGFALAVVFGSAVGALWWRTRAGYLRGILIAMPGWVVMKCADGFMNFYAILFGSVLFVTMCAVAGLVRDLRRDEGGNGL